ncbi:MAG: hypothetical protein DMG65_19390 [Candidatus Angelobacter sp. Gp1-AA117]|nr:MAG: hypothetical protein DMG65_19390 [Candidatus Angelobacter sp. Gp1-AA117]
MHNPARQRKSIAVLLIAILLFTASPSMAYSVLTHEQVVDFLWDSNIKRILLQRYPQATAEELRKAHAYAYGGCLIQDMGYYPFGNKFFSDLVHYVRSGDFVIELMSDAHGINELAFALGALAHYASDNVGHPVVNTAVALGFPKLRAKFGDQVTYVESHSAHIQTEFGFDVLQVAKQRYTSQAYHDFIGFEVAQPLLERAFLKTYGLELKQILPDEEHAIGTYRRAVANWVPKLTQVALITEKKELEALPNFSPKNFRYLLSRTEYEKEWGKNYQKPGAGARVLALLVKLLPKVGPLRALDPKPPTPETEKMYIQSVEDTVNAYRELLVMVANKSLQLANRDFDTGKPTAPGEYELADKTYADLLKKLSKDNFARMSPALRSNILAFYSDPGRPVETRKHKDEWRDTVKSLALLKSAF